MRKNGGPYSPPFSVSKWFAFRCAPCYNSRRPRTNTPGCGTPVAYQASPRGGALYCTREGGRIRMSGRAALYAVSDTFVN